MCLQTRNTWGITGAGEKIGESIERATSNAVDKVGQKLLPDIAKMLTGEAGLSPQLIKGVQGIADKTLETVEQRIIPEVSRQISEQMIPQAGSEMREVSKSVVDHLVPTIRKEMQQMISSIRFDDGSKVIEPDRLVFDSLRESFLRNQIRYLDCHALGEGYKIRSGVTDEKHGPVSMVFNVLPGGLLTVDCFLKDVFVQDRALLRMSSIFPLIQFHIPEKGTLLCRVTIPPQFIDDGALAAISFLRFAQNAMLPVAEAINGEEKLEDIHRQVRSLTKALIAS